MTQLRFQEEGGGRDYTAAQHSPLVPAKAGTQRWIPAYAGMSGYGKSRQRVTMCVTFGRLRPYMTADTFTGMTAMIKRPAFLLSLALAAAPFAAQAEPAVTIPPPAAETAAPSSGLETAVLAGGCFWGIQAVYQHTKGVTNAVSGYAGGTQKEADYQV